MRVNVRWGIPEQAYIYTITHSNDYGRRYAIEFKWTVDEGPWELNDKLERHTDMVMEACYARKSSEGSKSRAEEKIGGDGTTDGDTLPPESEDTGDQ
jgi:hypothetical protein